MTAPVDVLAIGNALVDVLSTEDDGFLDRHGLAKGTMRLIDGDQADALYAAMGPAVEVSGGAACNTVAGVASLGGRAVLLGRVRDDQLGAVFAHDIRAAGVGFPLPPATSGPPTGRCLVVVTPDAERTLSTFLGASVELGPDDVDEGLVAMAAVTLLEGYLWDAPGAREAFRKAMAAAHQAGRRVAFSLSDPLLVRRFRPEFVELVDAGHVDVLLANEREICALYEVDRFEDALPRVRGHCAVAALTRHERGSVVVVDGDVHVIDPEPVAQVVDTTGAGDLYAAGFLYGITRGDDPATCGRLGSVAAAEAIGHLGARPQAPLARLVAAAGLG